MKSKAQTEAQIELIWRELERNREGEKQRGRETEREGNKEGEKQRGRETERERNRERGRETERECVSPAGFISPAPAVCACGAARALARHARRGEDDAAGQADGDAGHVEVVDGISAPRKRERREERGRERERERERGERGERREERGR
jgi:hypothetical protein